MKDHKDLDVWKRSVDLVKNIYEATSRFPREELFGLTNQMRRAAVSIPSNIAEGAARQTEREFVQFLFVALGSASELETQAIIAERLRYLDSTETILVHIDAVKKMLNGLIRHYRGKGNGNA